jgi:hypothetical protein
VLGAVGASATGIGLIALGGILVIVGLVCLVRNHLARKSDMGGGGILVNNKSNSVNVEELWEVNVKKYYTTIKERNKDYPLNVVHIKECWKFINGSPSKHFSYDESWPCTREYFDDGKKVHLTPISREQFKKDFPPKPAT